MRRRDLLRRTWGLAASALAVGVAGCTGEDAADEQDADDDDEDDEDDADTTPRDGLGETHDGATDSGTETMTGAGQFERSPDVEGGDSGGEEPSGSIGGNAVSELRIVDHTASVGDSLRVEVRVQNTGEETTRLEEYDFGIVARYESGNSQEAPFVSQEGGDADLQPGAEGTITVDAAVPNPDEVVHYRIELDCGTFATGAYC